MNHATIAWFSLYKQRRHEELLVSPKFLFCGKFIEIALDINERRTLIARTGRQVAQRTDKVGQATGSRSHVSDKALALFLSDTLLDRLLKLFSRKLGEIVIRQVFQLQLVRRTLKTCGICGGNNRIGKLPDLSYGILKCTVTVNHNLDELSGLVKETLLNILDQILTFTGEELDLILGGLVGAKQTVLRIVSALTDRSAHDLVHTVNDFKMGMGGMQQPMMGGMQPQVSYMLAVNGQQAGPFGWAQLQQLVQQGQLTQQTYVWTRGMANWTPAGQVTELAVLFQSTAPPLSGMLL